ncbi:uncharacterized protein FFB20_01759 [Fusarium fujikuroi]|nr:uncharacterized protein FFB20_01759 [Fusarium fujikuroi]
MLLGTVPWHLQSIYLRHPEHNVIMVPNKV